VSAASSSATPPPAGVPLYLLPLPPIPNRCIMLHCGATTNATASPGGHEMQHLMQQLVPRMAPQLTRRNGSRRAS